MENTNKIKFYVSAILTLTSPLHIGNGMDDNTDSDILMTKDNKPFIPASTLAGKSRHTLQELQLSDIDVDALYGSISKDKNESKLIFYDADIITKKFAVTIRDNVRINEYGVAMDKGKFDYEILESGSSFLFRGELLCDSEESGKSVFGIILGLINNGDITFGAKTARGLGQMTVSMPKYLSIDLYNEMPKYIDFHWYKSDKDNELNNEQINEDLELLLPSKMLYEKRTINFDIESYLLVRNYSTLATHDNKIVSSEQLMNANKKAVIPGTSWAGVFRHHIERILSLSGYTDPDELVNTVFGYVNEDTKERRISHIRFSESTIDDKMKLRNRTRNAVDRFTGGAGDKKLYTTRPGFYGSGDLTISIPADLPQKQLIKSLIDICVDDLKEGFLNIGGEGSVGGGRMKITDGGSWI